jgi:protein-S-isoprenylcysteine O-methyltransferase Ste14
MTMQHTEIQIDRGARIYLVRTLVAPVLYAVLFFISAGTADAPRAWLYFAVLLAISAATNAYLYHTRPALLYHRNQWKRDARGWDKILTPAAVITGVHLQAVVMGLNWRFHWPVIDPLYIVPGLLLLLASTGITTWAMAVNTHFEATVRIQEDRSHRVVDTGPYRWIRHPGYLGFLLVMVAAPLTVGAPAGFINAAVAGTLIIIRTYWEDRTLKKDLHGYKAYSDRVRYRLLPGLW